MDAPSSSAREAPKLTVVIPARNEETAIAGVIEEMAAALRGAGRFEPFEMFVVDDGSTDSTGETAHRAGATVLRNDTPGGYGAALKLGIRSGRAPYVCFVDADHTYPVGELPSMLVALEDGADQIIGARAAAIPLLRRMVKALVTRFAAFLARHPIPDLNSGLRCVRRARIVPILAQFPDGFSFTTTLTIAGLLLGWDVRWHPIAYRARTGTSKFRPVRDTLRLLVCLIRAVVRFKPLRVVSLTGRALALAILLGCLWGLLTGPRAGGALISMLVFGLAVLVLTFVVEGVRRSA